MMSPVVFVGGAPGTGKSTLSRELERFYPSVRCVNAGQMIRRQLGIGDRYLRPPVEDEARAAFLQELLVAEFRRIQEHEPSALWLIDGHYAVPTRAGPVSVAPHVFERLGVTRLALVSNRLEVIGARLRLRGGAAWWDESDVSLRTLIEADEAQAREVAACMRLPLWRWEQPEDAVRDLRDTLELELSK